MADLEEKDIAKMIFGKLLLNTDKEKKKPHNITIKNNSREPKSKQDIRYSAKQNYRRYKSLTEPKLTNKIMVDDEDDITTAIKKEFANLKRDKKEVEVATSEAPAYKPPDKDEDPETIFTRDDRPRYKLSDFADAISKTVLDQAVSELDEEGSEMNTSAVSDIDPKLQESLLGQITVAPFTPEVRFRERDMSALSSRTKGGQGNIPKPSPMFLGKLVGKTDEEITNYVRGRNRFFNDLDIEQKAQERGYYEPDAVSRRDARLKEISAGIKKKAISNQIQQHAKRVMNERRSEATTLGATALGATPSGGGGTPAKRGRPVGSKNKPKGNVLDFTKN